MYFSNKRAIILVAFLSCLVWGLCGCDDEGTSKSSGISKQQAEELRQEITRLKSKVSQLENENQNLRKERDEAQSVAKSRYITLSIIAYTALGIAVLLIGGFILILRLSKHVPSKIPDDNLHCPRCGWEHGPKESVCKNCKTHF